MKYSITDFLEKRKDMPFKEFVRSIKRANDMYDSEFLHKKFKTKDEEYFARHYFKMLDCMVGFFYENEMKSFYQLCDNVKTILYPYLKEYVDRGEAPEYSLKAFE